MNEEDVEISRNLKLKAKLAEVQSEVKTLKKFTKTVIVIIG